MLLNEFVYEIESAGESSAKYGNCQICGKYCTEIFSQIEKRLYKRRDGGIGKTFYGCAGGGFLLGHYDCLIKARKRSEKQ